MTGTALSRCVFSLLLERCASLMSSSGFSCCGCGWRVSPFTLAAAAALTAAATFAASAAGIEPTLLA